MPYDSTSGPSLHPNGASFEILAADAPGAWGKRPRRLIVDEYARWPTTEQYQILWTALYSALGKVPGSRLAILTSAGDDQLEPN